LITARGMHYVQNFIHFAQTKPIKEHLTAVITMLNHKINKLHVQPCIIWLS